MPDTFKREAHLLRYLATTHRPLEDYRGDPRCKPSRHYVTQNHCLSRVQPFHKLFSHRKLQRECPECSSSRTQDVSNKSCSADQKFNPTEGFRSVIVYIYRPISIKKPMNYPSLSARTQLNKLIPIIDLESLIDVWIRETNMRLTIPIKH